MPVNYLAILVVSVLNMALGALWYSPVLFSKPWMKLVGKSEKELQKEGASKYYLITFVGTLVMTYVLSQVLQLMQVQTPTEAFAQALWLWLGFVAITHFPNYLFEGRPMKLFLINVGYPLVYLVLAAVVLTLWK